MSNIVDSARKRGPPPLSQPPPDPHSCHHHDSYHLKEIEDLKQENAKLQEKLAKARALVLALQKEAQEAKAERDKERLRAESLHKSSQQLLRQLKRESSRMQELEHQQGLGHQSWMLHGNSGGLECDAEELATGQAPLGNDNLLAAAPAQEAQGKPSLARALSGFAFGTNGHMQVEDYEAQRAWEFVVQGQHDPERQENFAQKIISCFPDNALERARQRGVVCLCCRGKRLDVAVPNQDDFVIARHALVNGGHIALYGVFDGFGPAGHLCSSYVRGVLPESLFSQQNLLLKTEDTLRDAFRKTQESLLRQSFDTAQSGTTAALALVLNIPDPQNGPGESWLFIAHVGDSRAILASQRGGDPSAFTVTALTKDHRPDCEEEAERIRQSGGEIRKLRENAGAARVFAKGQDRPALALTRTLGASAAKDCGVISEPEVAAYKLRAGVDVVLILGTDGLFEFCTNSQTAGMLLKDGLKESTLSSLFALSRQNWTSRSFNETVDDITVIAAALPPDRHVS